VPDQYTTAFYGLQQANYNAAEELSRLDAIIFSRENRFLLSASEI